MIKSWFDWPTPKPTPDEIVRELQGLAQYRGLPILPTSEWSSMKITRLPLRRSVFGLVAGPAHRVPRRKRAA